jgi:predicted metalloprotease
MRGSDNLEDREAAGPPGRGLSGGVKLGGAGLIAVVVISLLFGLNPLFVLVSLQGGDPLSAPTQSAPPPTPSGSAVRDDTKEFVVRILGDTEDTLKDAFRANGRRVPSAPSRAVPTTPMSTRNESAADKAPNP